jgi:hypothetical protein
MLENVREAARGRLGPAAENEVSSTACGPAGGGTSGVLRRIEKALRVLENIALVGCVRVVGCVECGGE